MMLRTSTIIAIFIILIPSICAASEGGPSKSFISFKEAEAIALQNSHTIAAQKYVVESAREDAAAQKVKMYPSLSLGAQSMFMSNVGKISFPETGVTRSVGDHINWSVGPAIEWVMWDTGKILNKARSLNKIADAQSNNLDYSARQVLLNTRIAYIGVELADEQVSLVREALALARAQYADVSEKNKVGTSDKLDLTVAHQEVVDREKDLESAQGELAVSKRTLIAVLGFNPEQDDPDSIKVEPIKSVLNLLLPRSDAYVDIEAHPQVKALADQEQSAVLAAKSSSARHWPEVVMHGSSTFEYPNLGENTTIQQNKATLGLHVPILDWGMINKESRSYKYQARSAGEQKEQTSINIARDTSEIRERISTLKDLRTANDKSVRDAVEVAKLTYDSFQAGRLIFLDVQRSNVKALAVKVDSARTDAELAVQISKLLAMAENEGAIQ